MTINQAREIMDYLLEARKAGRQRDDVMYSLAEKYDTTDHALYRACLDAVTVMERERDESYGTCVAFDGVIAQCREALEQSIGKEKIK